MSFPDITPTLRAHMPGLRGALQANAPMAPLSWFRTGGPAQALLSPVDEADLALALAGTLTEEEMLDDGLPSAEVLRRLFHAEGLAVGRPRALAYGCRCSRARLSGVLSGLGEDDLDHMAQDDGVITMTCEFCNLDFRFERAEVRGVAARG